MLEGEEVDCKVVELALGDDLNAEYLGIDGAFRGESRTDGRWTARKLPLAGGLGGTSGHNVSMETMRRDEESRTSDGQQRWEDEGEWPQCSDRPR